MTTKAVISALNKEGVQAISRLLQIIGIPALTVLGTIFINQANTIISQQAQIITASAEHDRKLLKDSTDIRDIVRSDRLFRIKQDATKAALDANSEIGIEFRVDYDQKYDEAYREILFINP